MKRMQIDRVDVGTVYLLAGLVAGELFRLTQRRKSIGEKTVCQVLNMNPDYMSDSVTAAYLDANPVCVEVGTGRVFVGDASWEVIPQRARLQVWDRRDPETDDE